jgi:hypothetical protein
MIESKIKRNQYHLNRAQMEPSPPPTAPIKRVWKTNEKSVWNNTREWRGKCAKRRKHGSVTRSQSNRRKHDTVTYLHVYLLPVEVVAK